MNNEQYLKQISSKPVAAANKKQNKFLSPTAILIGAGALIAIVLLVAISSILGQTEARTHQLTETFYQRVTMLSKDDSPVATYAKHLSSSNLRALSVNLQSKLIGISRSLETLLPDVGINPTAISANIMADTQSYIGELGGSLEYARLNSLLERTYSRNITLVISQLLAIQSELGERIDKTSYLYSVLNQASTELQILETEFINYTNSH